MYKLTLLLIPMILLSSCTIDWNDEKDKKIAELETQIQQTENTDKKLNAISIQIEPVKGSHYANILQSTYEWGSAEFYDTNTDMILFHIDAGHAQKVTSKDNILTVLIAGIYWPHMIYRYDLTLQTVTKKEIIDDRQYETIMNQ